MSYSKKILLYPLAALLLISCCVFGGTLYWRTDVAHYLLSQYMASKGLKSQFKIKSLSLSHTFIQDLSINEKVKISEISLNLTSLLSLSPHLTNIQVTADVLDLPEMIKIINVFSSAGQKTDPQALNFSTIKNYCSYLSDMQLELSLKTLSWHTALLPINLRLQHSANTPTYSLTFSGKTETPHENEMVSLKKSDFQGDLSLVCQAELIDLQISHLNLNVDQLISHQPNVHIPSLKFTGQRGQISITPDEQLLVKIPLMFDVTWGPNNKLSNVKSENVWIDLQTSLVDFSKFKGLITGHTLSLRNEYTFSLKKIKVDSSVMNINSPSTGHFTISGLQIKDQKNNVLLAGIDSSGEFIASSDSYSLKGNISDSSKTLSFRNLGVQFFPKIPQIALLFPKKQSSIALSSKSTKLFPLITKYTKSLSGALHLAGAIKGFPPRLSGSLNIDGKDLHIDSEYGKLEGLSFSHTFLEWPSLKSNPHGVLSVDRITFGPSIESFNAKYTLTSLERIDVEQLHLKYEGAVVEAPAFQVFPQKSAVEGFLGKVSNLELQKLLALGLKDTATAAGTLAGHIKLKYKNKIPSIEGSLAANGPGWIRYRAGGVQKNAIQLTDNPLDILRGYLYDFSYQTLNVNIKTDESYKINMELHTLGYNPHYVKGKPLKLKINLEQNLLAAIQSMMLTYDLPNKLKEKLQGVEAP